MKEIGPLKNCHLDHVAIVVNSLDEGQKFYEDIGVSFKEEREVVSSQGVSTAFGKVDERSSIELLEPYGEDGPIHKFLKKNGPGIHHLCFRVLDVKEKMEELKEKGYRLLYETPQKGAHHCLVNFIHPKSAGGVLVEISEYLGDKE